MIKKKHDLICSEICLFWFPLLLLLGLSSYLSPFLGFHPSSFSLLQSFVLEDALFVVLRVYRIHETLLCLCGAVAFIGELDPSATPPGFHWELVIGGSLTFSLVKIHILSLCLLLHRFWSHTSFVADRVYFCFCLRGFVDSEECLAIQVCGGVIYGLRLLSSHILLLL